MKAHFFKDKGAYRFSGHNACGDVWDGRHSVRGVPTKPRRFDAIVDIGREFIITSHGTLYIIGPGKGQFLEFLPGEVVLAAKCKMFGFSMVQGG